MPKELRKGDIVQLNSGGPDMTVVSCDGENVEVKWNGTGSPATFPIQCVTLHPAIQQSTRRDPSSPLPSRE